jgi:iron complex transport system substrate-binding protein
MKWMRWGGWLAALSFFPMIAVSAEKRERIVAIGGPVTEIVFALGRGSEVVAVDSSSVYPEAVTKLPQVGYQRSLSTEGVLSLRPTRIVASTEAGPPQVVAQLKASGIPYVEAPAQHSVEGARVKITVLAKALDREAEGRALCAELDRRMARVKALLGANLVRPKVLFVYARGAGTMNIAGADTAADAMIALAGGVNAVSGYDGYKPMTPEALAAAAPEVILIPNRGLESLGGVDGLFRQPGVSLTPAGRNRRIVALDDLLLLGFGPRLADAVEQLAGALHPALAERWVGEKTAGD